MKRLLVLLGAEVLFVPAFTQNIAPNPSFEDLDAAHPNSPSALSQLQHLTDWKNFESSDLISQESGKYNSLYLPNYAVMQAHTGTKFIGFGPCEGAQAKLTETVPAMNWVTVSLWFSPNDFEDTEINVYLLEEKAPDGALVDCYNPDIGYEVNFKIPVRADNTFLNAEHVPGSWYHYVSAPQLVADKEYKWIALKGENIPGDVNSDKYVYVDDISVEKFEYCDHICAGSGITDPIVFTNIIPNAMYGNSYLNFFTTVQNATEVEMTVWDTWGGESYYWHSFDLNGLADPGYSDFAIVWNGNSTATGGDFIANTAYPIRIVARNCVDLFWYDGMIVVTGIDSPPANPYAATQNRLGPDCCPDYQYIQNVVYPANNKEIVAVDDFIKAGYSVTAPPFGPVAVSDQAVVSYRAGNYIDLDTGFQVLPGGNFEAFIEPCGASPKSLVVSERDYYEQLRSEHPELSRQTELSHETPAMLAPNPTTHTTTLYALRNTDQEVRITNLYGNTVERIAVRHNTQEIDMTNHPAGLYLISVIDDTGVRAVYRLSVTH